MDIMSSDRITNIVSMIKRYCVYYRPTHPLLFRTRNIQMTYNLAKHNSEHFQCLGTNTSLSDVFKLLLCCVLSNRVLPNQIVHTHIS
jgi:hypothetical protein